MAACVNDPMSLRQQVLVLHLANPSLASPVVAWARYDGTGAETGTPGDQGEPPYATGLAALQDGWRLLQMPQLAPPAPGMEHVTSHLKYGFLFEKLADVAPR